MRDTLNCRRADRGSGPRFVFFEYVSAERPDLTDDGRLSIKPIPLIPAFPYSGGAAHMPLCRKAQERWC